jgi:hypothetical protein
VAVRNFNAWQRFRPLRSGLGILCGPNGQEGTLGFIALDAQGDPWLISAAHVLGGTNATLPTGGLSVFQPIGPASTEAVANATALSRDSSLDVAAAVLLAGVGFVNEALGVGPLAPPILAKTGMRVVKAGALSGITEGEVLDVAADDITIGLPKPFPPSCQLAEGGDSGALWIECSSRAPIGIHYASSGFGIPKAYARPLPLVLSHLGLWAP